MDSGPAVGLKPFGKLWVDGWRRVVAERSRRIAGLKLPASWRQTSLDYFNGRLRSPQWWPSMSRLQLATPEYDGVYENLAVDLAGRLGADCLNQKQVAHMV